MSANLHMPHPHIADRFAAAFEHALHHGHTAPSRDVPAAPDWDDWHYPDTSGYTEVQG